MSSPRVLGTTLEARPAPHAYLSAEADRASLWRTRLRPDGRKLIGLSWQGNPKAANDKGAPSRWPNWCRGSKARTPVSSCHRRTRGWNRSTPCPPRSAPGWSCWATGTPPSGRRARSSGLCHDGAERSQFLNAEHISFPECYFQWSFHVCRTFAPPPRFAHNRRLHGFSLIETAIVLGVVGLIIGGVWIAASAVRRKLDENRFFDGLLHIITEVQKQIPIYQPCDTGYLNDSTVRAMGIIPKDWGETSAGTPDLFGPDLGPSIWVDCGGGNPYARIVWWPYGDSTKISRSECEKVEDFLQARLKPEDLRVYPNCSQNPAWTVGTTVTFGVTLRRKN